MSWGVWEEVICGGPKPLRALTPHFTSSIHEAVSQLRHQSVSPESGTSPAPGGMLGRNCHVEGLGVAEI